MRNVPGTLLVLGGGVNECEGIVKDGLNQISMVRSADMYVCLHGLICLYVCMYPWIDACICMWVDSA